MRFQASAIGRRKVAPTDRLVLDGVVLEGADFSGRRLLQFTAVAARFIEINVSA